jgi:aminopeptidase N
MTIERSETSSLLRLLFPLIFLFFFQVDPARSHDRFNYRDLIDVQKYTVSIEVNDSTNAIKGTTVIKALLKSPADTIWLDLASRNKENKGMTIDSILCNGFPVHFRHINNQIRLPSHEANVNGTTDITVYYKGIPIDGLVISKNIYGQRTFFADNWPDRAHNWFPSVDHPSDKALVDFIITAPSHYQVIATGLLLRKVNIPGKRTTHYWSSSVPVSTKIMAFGAAEFAVEYNGTINGTPYSNWVYHNNMETGFSHFSDTRKIFEFFSEMIAPYPFEKIANVQSTTRYGGMENAGNIFYPEIAVRDTGSIKTTIVHEMAHQWFGNSVTESDWPHLWLSEGIATWLTGWYIEQNYGAEKLSEILISHREKIIEYARVRLVPVVDHHIENYTGLLNPNSYQKGAWILHMLRNKTGEEIFLRGLVEFYNRHKLSHASSDDFINVMQEFSGLDLDQFFDDWLYSAGHPVLTVNKRFGNGRLNIELIQAQQHKMAFTFPLDIRFLFEDGTHMDYAFDIMFRRHEFIIDMPSEPVEIIIDPEVKLLFELNT